MTTNIVIWEAIVIVGYLRQQICFGLSPASNDSAFLFIGPGGVNGLGEGRSGGSRILKGGSAVQERFDCACARARGRRRTI